MNFMRYFFHFGLLLFCLLSYTACQPENSGRTASTPNGKIAVVYIGSDSIVASDLDLRREIVALDTAIEHPRSLALLQLLKASAQEQIAAEYGFPLQPKLSPLIHPAEFIAALASPSLLLGVEYSPWK